MNHSCQQERSKARVNLSVDVLTQGGMKTVELPHKVLVLGDFSAGQGMGPLQNRKRQRITRETRDAVLAHYSPILNICLQNKINARSGNLHISLKFTSLQDFHPEAIVSRVPDLKKLLAMRHLLRDLRSQLVDKPQLKSALFSLISDETQRLALYQELSMKLSVKEG